MCYICLGRPCACNNCDHAITAYVFLNQARAGLWLVHTWFLEIVPVRTSVCVFVYVCVCVCVCVRPRGY